MTIKSIIVAADGNNAIGKDNNLLCYLPNDLKYFKTITEGHSIIMGRKTFESLPNGALANRRNIVISYNKCLKLPNCEVCLSIEEAIELCNGEDEIFFIGGGSIYKKVIDIADRIYLTSIHHEFEKADTFFPEINATQWKQVFREGHEVDEKHKYRYSFLRFEKINS